MKLIKVSLLIQMILKLKIKKIKYGKSIRGNRPYIINNGIITLGKRVNLNSYPDGELYLTGLQAHLKDSIISIGDNCNLNGTMIHCRDKVIIGNYCMFGPGTKIVDNNSHKISTNPIERRKAPDSKAIVINDNVWVGMNSLILKGVTIGKNSIIAAHSVVTKDVPENTLVGGNPAKFIKKLTDYE